jgi:ABC-type histidine transport system ATPase subunit
MHLIKEHDVATTTIFLEKEVICQFGVPKYILTNNGSEWMKEFDALC